MDWLFVVAATGLFAFGMWRFTVNWDARTKARDGLVAAQMTGQLLNRLIGPDCIVTHDLPCEGFTIDHTVIAPPPLIPVESNALRTPTSAINDSPLKLTSQAEAPH